VAVPPDELRGMAADLRERRSDSRVVLRIGVYFEPEPGTRGDERGRHAVVGPSEWVAERLREYVDVGVDGFVVNLDHQQPGLGERVARFVEEVVPLIGR
jgi:alkanesulfonate monooxygenase SsuD/methylene tetrahydromethanopterin reductase-like flavin-dependent oxidoreductase (luciferase family)